MIAILISIIGILVTIIFVVGTHEYAHFIVARLAKVKVLRFSIGFGKILWQFRDKRGTEYAFSLIPLGGYVKMLDEGEGHVPKNQLAHAFNRQAFYKKFLIVAAGPLMNIFCALILYWIIFMIGFTTVKPIIGNITPRSIAAESGLKARQEIIRIDGHKTTTWTGVIFRAIAHAGNQDHMLIEVKNANNAKTESYNLDLSNWHMEGLTPDPISSLGIIPYAPDAKSSEWQKTLLRHIQYGPYEAMHHALLEIGNFTYFNALILGKIITGKLSLKSLGGPITIFESAGDALNSGLIAFIGFLAFISISLGIINLIPIPGLDGGHLFIFIIEWIIRRPLPITVLAFLYRVGFILVLFLLIQALVNDLLRL